MVASSVQIFTISPGDGLTFPKAGDKVKVAFKEFLDPSCPHPPLQESGEDGFTFEVGTGNVLEGWDEAIPKLSLGEKALLAIPPDLAYGQGFPPEIPPDSTIYVEIMLLAIN